MAEKKKKSWRKEYLNDFKPDEDGKYSYQGKMKTFSNEELAARPRAGSAGASAIFFILAAGFVTGRDIGGKAYVLIPYLVLLGAFGIAAWNVFALGRGGEVRSYIAKRAVPRIVGGATTAFVSAILAAAGAVLAIIGAPGTELIYKISFMTLMLLSAADAYLMRKAGESIDISGIT